jgi:hypothetical protein|tara:strand:- start:191 stop:346 length:156 start_codon:yes stop_codon:yes gene_type:complete
MAMTKKDYEAIAKIIKFNETKSQVTLGLASIFEDDNPNFDTGKFLKACKED